MIKLHLSDISIRMSHRPHNWHNVDITKTIEFPHSKKIFCGTPLIIAGLWSLEHVQQMTALDVMSAHGPLPITDLISYYNYVDLTHRTIYEIDMSDQEQIVQFFMVRSAVVDKTKMKYVRLNFDGVSDDASVDALKTMRSLLPDMVIIAGPCLVHHYAQAFGAAGTDIVAIGHQAGSVMMDNLSLHGVEISEVDLIRRHFARSEDVVLADVPCFSPGDVAKCLALGADFVGIGPDMKNFTIEQICEGIRYVCSMRDVDNIDDLPLTDCIDGIIQESD